MTVFFICRFIITLSDLILEILSTMALERMSSVAYSVTNFVYMTVKGYELLQINYKIKYFNKYSFV